MMRFFFCLLFLSSIIGCKNKDESDTKSKVIINPNPTSEIAQQMRDMTLDLEKIKSRLENN